MTPDNFDDPTFDALVESGAIEEVDESGNLPAGEELRQRQEGNAGGEGGEGGAGEGEGEGAESGGGSAGEGGKAEAGAGEGDESGKGADAGKEAGKGGEGGEPLETTVDYDTVITELSGGQFKSRQEFEQVFGKLKNIEGEGSLSDRLEAVLNNKTSFADPYVQKLNEYIEQGGTKEDFDRVQALDVTKMDDIEKLVAEFKLTNPNAKLSDQDLRNHFKDKYHQGEIDTDDETAVEAQRKGKISLAVDAGKAEATILEKKKELAVPAAAKEAISFEEQDKQRVDAWSGKIPEYVSKVNQVETPLPGKEGEKFVYTIPEGKEGDAIRDDLQHHLSELVAYSMMDVNNPEHQKVALKLLENRIWDINREKILLAYGKKVRGMSDEEFDAEAHHEQVQTQEIPPKTDTPSGDDNSIGAQIAEFEGLNL